MNIGSLIILCLCLATFVTAVSKKGKVIDTKDRFEKIEVFIQDQLQTIHHLQRKVVAQGERILELESKLMQRDKQKHEANLFRRQVVTGKTSSTPHVTNKGANQPGHLCQRNGRQHTTISLFTNVHPIRGGINNTVKAAFSAYLNSSIFHLGAGQTVKYDNVMLNEGNHYSGLTGIFTCPVGGVYVFSFFIDQWGEPTHLLVSLVVDGEKKVQGVANPTQTHQDVQGGNIAILRLRAGQRVWVENYHPNGHIWASDRNRYDTFSGFLLFQ